MSRSTPAVAAATNANHRARALGALGTIYAADVRELWARQTSCVECGEGRGLDHIVPLSQGGINAPDNLQNLCPRCNARKSQRDRGQGGECGHTAGVYMRKGRYPECMGCRAEARRRYNVQRQAVA